MKAINIGLGALRAILAVVGVILTFVLVSRWTPELETERKATETLAFLGKHSEIDTPLTATMNLTFFMLAACAAAAIIFGIIAVAQNPKRNLRAIAGIVLVAAIVGIGYAMASDSVMHGYWNAGSISKLGIGLEDQTAPVSKYSGMGLISFYILLGITLLSVVYLEVSKIFK